MTLNLAHLNEFNTSLEQRSHTPTQIKLVGLRELSNIDPREKRASFVFNLQGDNLPDCTPPRQYGLAQDGKE